MEPEKLDAPNTNETIVGGSFLAHAVHWVPLGGAAWVRVKDAGKGWRITIRIANEDCCIVGEVLGLPEYDPSVPKTQSGFSAEITSETVLRIEQAAPAFVQWRDKASSVYGVQFASQKSACFFEESVSLAKHKMRVAKTMQTYGSRYSGFSLDSLKCFPSCATHLPKELVADLLLEIPPSSLMVLALVCKYWSSVVYAIAWVGFSYEAEVKGAISSPTDLREVKNVSDYDVLGIPSYHEIYLVNKAKKEEMYSLSLPASTAVIFAFYPRYVDIVMKDSQFTPGKSSKIYTLWHLGRIKHDIVNNMMAQDIQEKLGSIISVRQFSFEDISQFVNYHMKNGRTVRYGFTQRISEQLICNRKINLQPHQQDALKWMKESEENGVQISTCWRVPLSLFKTAPAQYYKDMSVYLDVCHKSVVFDTKMAPENTKTLYGALFCDEVGLGKRRTIAALIAEAPRCDEAFLTGRVEFPKSLAEQHFPLPLKTKATLVICKSPLIEVWIEELSLVGIKPFTITSHTQNYMEVLARIMKEDVVIVSREVFKDYQYMDEKLFTDTGQELCDIILKDFNYDYPILHALDWHRICLDEGHELERYVECKRFLTLHGKNRYFLSATPFSNTEQIHLCLRFFHLIPPDSTKTMFHHHFKNSPAPLNWYKLFTELVKLLLWRNIAINVEIRENAKTYGMRIITPRTSNPSNPSNVVDPTNGSQMGARLTTVTCKTCSRNFHQAAKFCFVCGTALHDNQSNVLEIESKKRVREDEMALESMENTKRLCMKDSSLQSVAKQETGAKPDEKDGDMDVENLHKS